VPQFLSDGWFSEVEKIRAEAGEIPMPDVVKNIKLNIVVTEHPEGEKQMHLAAGDFKQGLLDDAPTKITVSFPVASAIFLDDGQQVGIQAFMSGQVKFEGDMSVMMQMQAAGQPSAEARALRKRIREITTT
jgi:hypothetical protein